MAAVLDAAGIGLGLLVICAVLLGGLWPFLVQQFQVRPNEPDRERPYIERNIAATREAYGVSDVDSEEYRATTEVEAGQLEEDSETIPGIRLLDPNVVPLAFQQLQQVRGFYAFSDPLDVDRYEVNGENRDVVVAVRDVDLTGIPEGQQNWNNEHTVYTHGFGFVAAYGNTRAANGSPSWEEDIPPTGEPRHIRTAHLLRRELARVLDRRCARGPPVEFDIPEDPDAGGQQRNNTYDGEGGVLIGSFLNRLLYATKFQEGNILLTGRINDESTILYDRDPRLRLEKVAPWLTVDGNLFPAVVGDRIVVDPRRVHHARLVPVLAADLVGGGDQRLPDGAPGRRGPAAGQRQLRPQLRQGGRRRARRNRDAVRRGRSGARPGDARSRIRSSPARRYPTS